MQNIYIFCEGKTEVNFVKQILCSYISNTVLIPITLPTGYQDGNVKKGGGRSYQKWIKCIKDVMLDNGNNCYYTTMFDLYKMPSDIHCNLNNLQPLQKAMKCEQQLKEDLGSLANFIPYVQVHEFEALLFVDSASTAKFLSTEASTQQKFQQQINEINRTFDSPEDINGGEATAPSKRLISLTSRYGGMKTRAWEALSDIDAIRSKCTHFDNWLKKLDAL